MKLALALLIALVLISASFLTTFALNDASINNTENQIDTYISQQMKEGQIPGLSIGIIESGEITLLKGYGTSDENGSPVTPQTPFTMGSIGKIFTALSIRQLAGQGRIDYNAPVQKYIPWFTLADSSAAAQIRIIDLIEHKSGLSQQSGVEPALYNSPSIERAVNWLKHLRPDRPVGSSEEYSNLNYIILGCVVETVSGMKYEEYIQQNIINPLELNNTFPSQKMMGNTKIAQGHYVAYGLTLTNNEPLPQAMVPAGFQVTSADDLIKFAMIYLNNGYFKDKSIFPNNMLPERNTSNVYTASDQRYNSYWITETGDVQGHLGYFGHAGATNGFTSVMLINPVENRAIVILANCRNTGCYPEITAQTIGNDIATFIENGSFPATEHSNPGLWINILIAIVILALLVSRAIWAYRFRRNMIKGGVRKVWSLITFAMLDVILPIIILIGVPLYFECTWAYLLNSNMELWILVFTSAIILGGIGITKGIMLILRTTRKQIPNT